MSSSIRRPRAINGKCVHEPNDRHDNAEAGLFVPAKNEKDACRMSCKGETLVDLFGLRGPFLCCYYCYGECIRIIWITVDCTRIENRSNKNAVYCRDRA